MALSSENAGLTRRISTPTSPAPAVRRSGRTTVPSEVLADSRDAGCPGFAWRDNSAPEDGPAGSGGRHPGNSTACGGPDTGGQTAAIHLPGRASRRSSRVPGLRRRPCSPEW